MAKTHYRKVFKSDHLSSFDLEDFIEEGVILEFTIKEVKQYNSIKVAGKDTKANIAYFVEPIKPMVLNATNSAILAKRTGSSFVEDWKSIPVELYILKNITFGKEKVEGIRIKEEMPKAMTENDIKMIKGRVATFTTQAELNAYYSSLTAKEKANKDVVEVLKQKQIDLKQQG
jgi:hypothetical protein